MELLSWYWLFAYYHVDHHKLNLEIACLEENLCPEKWLAHHGAARRLPWDRQVHCRHCLHILEWCTDQLWSPAFTESDVRWLIPHSPPYSCLLDQYYLCLPHSGNQYTQLQLHLHQNGVQDLLLLLFACFPVSRILSEFHMLHRRDLYLLNIPDDYLPNRWFQSLLVHLATPEPSPWQPNHQLRATIWCDAAPWRNFFDYQTHSRPYSFPDTWVNQQDHQIGSCLWCPWACRISWELARGPASECQPYLWALCQWMRSRPRTHRWSWSGHWPWQSYQRWTGG